MKFGCIMLTLPLKPLYAQPLTLVYPFSKTIPASEELIWLSCYNGFVWNWKRLNCSCKAEETKGGRFLSSPFPCTSRQWIDSIDLWMNMHARCMQILQILCGYTHPIYVRCFMGETYRTSRDTILMSIYWWCWEFRCWSDCWLKVSQLL